MRIRDLLLILLALLLICGPIPSRAQEPPPDPRFGVVEAFWDTAAAVEVGVAWERVLFKWSELQPNGPDDWNTLHVPDEWLGWAGAQGREVVGLLKNTPHWATDADPPLEASPPRGLDLPLDDPANTWAAFVRHTVEFFGPRGVHRWIIWNEPDISPGVYGQEWAGDIEAYYQLLKVSYLTIKAADPGAQVHLAGLTFWHDQEWLKKFLMIAAADPDAPTHGYFFDVVSLHIYFQTDTVDYIVNEARADLAAFGLDKPVWINETNASPDTDPQWPMTRPRWRVDLREQASFILQAYALGLAAGAERIAVYKLIDADLPPGGEPFGLLRPDHSRRPAFTAYQLMTQHYAGVRSAQIQRQPSWAQVTLNRGERTTRVFWARTADAVSLTVSAWASQARLIDQEGNAQTLDGSSGSYNLTLPGARCIEETTGCFIGGPTLLLVEESVAGDAGASVVEQNTPTADADASPRATNTSRPTPPGGTVPATWTPTPTPSPPPTPTSSPTASPSPAATATPPSPTPMSPTASPVLPLFPSPLPSLAPLSTLEPVSTSTSDVYDVWLVFAGLIVILVPGLIGMIFWKIRSSNTRQQRRG